ncbi:MAG: primosomal protein N' [bacterium]|nr:primosomal protein N' [bacterium]
MENLKIVTVAPIAKNILNEDLTYFTTKEITNGALVVIPLRNKEVLGIATSISGAKEMKSELKTSEFGFKKIKKIVAEGAYLPDFITASKETAEYAVSSPGQIIRFLTPKAILNAWEKNKTAKDLFPPKILSNVKNRRFEISVLGLPDDERYSYYKSLIREEFAKKHSVFFILPTIHDAEECGEILKKGIEEYTVIMHNRLTVKTIYERWRGALEEQHPILIVATPVFLSLPREDIATIIIDKENSHFYKTMSRPFMDIRTFAEKLARAKPARLVLGDSIPRIEDIYNAQAGNFIQESPLKYRFPMNIYQEVIDMRKAGDSILSPKVKLAIKESIAKKEHALLICARKGLGTSTLCADCGEIILCTECSLPMVLHRTVSENIFLCNRCGRKSATDVKCTNCGSWKLKVLGVATERVEDEVRAEFPDARIFRIDGNAVKKYKQAREIITEFLQTPGAILIGTDMVLSYLNQNIETVAIISIDTLFSLPDYKMDENIFDLLTRLRLKTLKRFLIQTRKPDEKIFENVLSGDLLEFFRGEIKERKRFNYPPFKILIKITSEGPKNITNTEMDQLEKFLQNYEPSKFNAFIERVGNKDRVNILLKVDPEGWPPQQAQGELSPDIAETPYSNLLEILRSLPSRFIVRVDPENIL